MRIPNVSSAIAIATTVVIALATSACEPKSAPASAKPAVKAAAKTVKMAASNEAENANKAVAKDDADDAIRSIYPIKIDANPMAQRICEGFQTLHRTRKAQCCEQRVGFLLTSECTRIFSGALKGDVVKTDQTRVDACVSALEKSHEGCDWVGDFSRRLPPACENILTGTLDDGVKCRSSLECKSGLSCHGVSPTNAGTCGPAQKAGASCGQGIDPAATYLSAQLLEEHPSCEGFCANGRCHAIAAVGTRCVSDAHCGDDAYCARDVTSKKGRTAEKKRPNKVCRAGVRVVETSSRSLQERCVMR